MVSDRMVSMAAYDWSTTIDFESLHSGLDLDTLVGELVQTREPYADLWESTREPGSLESIEQKVVSGGTICVVTKVGRTKHGTAIEVMTPTGLCGWVSTISLILVKQVNG